MSEAEEKPGNVLSKDHHGGVPEWRFLARKRGKQSNKRGPTCDKFTITFLRADSEDEEEVVGPPLLLMNGRIVNNILPVDELRPATTSDNYLIMKIKVIASSEAEGHVLGLDEPDEVDSSSSSDEDD